MEVAGDDTVPVGNRQAFVERCFHDAPTEIRALAPMTAIRLFMVNVKRRIL